MALMLKENKLFVDNNTGASYLEVYAKIGNSQYNHTEKLLSFYILYFYDYQARLDDKQPIFAEQFFIPVVDFDNWFSPHIQDGTNLIRQAYLYLLQVPLMEFNPETLENEQVGLRWGDTWVSDT